LTPDGDALFTVNSLVMVHLPGTAPGALSLFLDSILQEVDVRTGLVVWEWHGLGHIPIADSYATTKTSPYFDAYHFNSIQQLSGNRVLASARDTSAVYEIDRASGHILWTLGGKASSFRMGRNTRFYFQHDAQLAGDRLTLFDDQGGPPFYAPSSRGLVLTLDMRRHTAKLVAQYRRPQNTLADSEGSFQTLAGGAKFLGFGSEPFFSAFSATGALTFDATLPKDDGSYRAFTYPWSATPPTRPALVAKRGASSGTDLYASWNGATTVARWQVLAGSSASSLKPLTVSRSRGFETHIGVSSTAAMFAVRALSSAGRILAQSPAMAAS
jgi:Arylsulfotransferase (ASST)